MRLSICWSKLSGYMAACWRALGEHPDIELQVLAWRPDPRRDHIKYDATLVEDIDVRLLDIDERSSAHSIRECVERHHPDVVMIPGWFWKPYRQVVDWAYRNRIPTIMAMDTSLRFTARQLAGRWFKAAYFKKIAGVFVPGERAYLMARLLGFSEGQIWVGAYGIDYSLFEKCLEARTANAAGWPRSFLYVGRYLQRKGIDTLIEAYGRYCDQVDDPWTLNCCGQGPLEDRLRRVAGVTNLGFVQPRDLPSTMTRAGAFVLPSCFEAWGVAMAEAGAAGLPLIASRSVGASAELLRDFFNGRRFDTGDPRALAEAMRWIHDNVDFAHTLGIRSQLLAEPFRAELWAKKLMALSREVIVRNG